jgi:hypothetical protein
MFLSAPLPDLPWPRAALCSVHFTNTSQEVKHFGDIRHAAKAALDSKSNGLRLDQGESRLSGTQQTVHPLPSGHERCVFILGDCSERAK